jgi:hypothetical protein
VNVTAPQSLASAAATSINSELGSSRRSQPNDTLSPEVRKAARKRIAAWLKAVEVAARSKKLKDLDCRVAAALTNYPSANHGKCWAGIKRLADQLGRSERTIRYAIERLTDAGLLSVCRGGQGWTSTYTFLIDGQEVFGSSGGPKVVPFDRQRFADQERQPIAGQERQRFADKPYELQPYEESLPPCPPSEPSDNVVRLSDMVQAERMEPSRQKGSAGEEAENADHREKLSREAAELTEACLEAIGIDRDNLPRGWRGLQYNMQGLVARGCDPAIVLAAFAQFGGRVIPHKNYVLKAVETALANDPGPFVRCAGKVVAPALDHRVGAPPGTVFVAEDTPDWDAWRRYYRSHGAPNGLRVAPLAYDLSAGRGRYFPSARPPQL